MSGAGGPEARRMELEYAANEISLTILLLRLKFLKPRQFDFHNVPFPQPSLGTRT